MSMGSDLENDFLSYNTSVLQVLKQHRLLRTEEEDDLRNYLAYN